MTKTADPTSVPFPAMNRLWPLPAVVYTELLLLFWIIGRDGELPTNTISLIVAIFIAAAGLTPALLRPTPVSALAGSIAILLAGLILTPLEFNSMLVTPSFARLSDAKILRIVNGTLLAPVLLQFTSTFPYEHQLPNWQTITSYATSIATLLALMLVSAPFGWPLAITLALISVIQISIALIRMAQASRSSPSARLVLLGMLFAQAPLIARPLLASVGLPTPPYELVLLAQLVLPATLTLAILRYDLFGITHQLRRSLAYTAVSGGMLACYLALTVGLVLALPQLLPNNRGIAAATGLLVAAAAFAPLRVRAQFWVDHRFYPEKRGFAQAITTAQEKLAVIIDRDSVVELLTHTLPEQIGASWALLTPPHAPEVAPYADYEAAWSMRLALGSQLFGRIWLGTRRSGLAYNQLERAQFDAVARQASLALAHADLVAELRSLNQSLEQRVVQRTSELLDRERLLTQLAERQRLARDLHDSVTQALFSLSLGARALRLQAQHNPQGLANDLAEQEQTAQQALSEMRALLHQLRTPAEQQSEHILVDLGATLHTAAEAIAIREQLVLQADLATSLYTVPELASELAFVVREALQNVARHSGVCAAALRLSYDDSILSMQVSDLGNGFDQNLLIPEQLGIRGIRERIEALGGTLTIRSAPAAGTDIYV